MNTISIIVFFSFLAVILFQIYRIFSEQVKYKKSVTRAEYAQHEVDYINYLMNKAVSEQLSIPEDFSLYLDRLHEILGWAFHSIFRLDEKRQVVVIRFTGYFPSWYMETMSGVMLVKVGDGAIGRAISTNQPSIIGNVHSDPRFTGVHNLYNKVGYKSLCCTPLRGRHKIMGGFCTYSATYDNINLDDASYFTTCTEFLAAILDTRLLEKYINLKNTRSSSQV